MLIENSRRHNRHMLHDDLIYTWQKFLGGKFYPALSSIGDNNDLSLFETSLKKIYDPIFNGSQVASILLD